MKRKMWAKEHSGWSEKDWLHVVFTDESKFNLFGSDGRMYCQRKPGEEFLERNVQKKVKHRGESLRYGVALHNMAPAGFITSVDTSMQSNTATSSPNPSYLPFMTIISRSLTLYSSKTMTQSTHHVVLRHGSRIMELKSSIGPHLPLI